MVDFTQRARSVPTDPEEQLLCEVMRRSLTSAETDARHLRCKNAKALWLGVEASEHLAREKKSAKAKAAHHTKEQARTISRLSGYISSALDIGITSTDNDDDNPSAVDAYTKEIYCRSSDRKGKGSAKKW